MQLFLRTLGEGEPIVILHGLYGCSDNWLTIAHQLAASHKIIIPDLRNHGRSPHDPSQTYAAMRDDVLALIESIADRPITLVGHSMGGKVAMLIALNRPELLSRLIVADIAPINYSSLTEPAPMAVFHLNLLNTLLATDLSAFPTLDSLREYWESRIGDTATCRFMLKNVQRAVTGFSWRINLSAIARHLPEILNGMEAFQGAQHGVINLPTLFLRGGNSDYVPPESYTHIKRCFPASQITTIPDAGHWLHAEQPDLFLEKIKIFLE